MFHPTVYENLKVAFENYIYDLDNVEQVVRITNREDLLDMAVMSRRFALQFALAEDQDVTGEIRLYTSVKELSAEILEQSDHAALCRLVVRFRYRVKDPAVQCEEAAALIQEVWEPEQSVKQMVSYEVDMNDPNETVYMVEADVEFDRAIGEEQIEDIPELVRHMIRTLEKLREV